MRLLGAGSLGVLGAGALLYSLSGNADGGGDDTKKRKSKGEVDRHFFNRSNEQKVFNNSLKGIPGVITVLVGPPSCGKSVRSAFSFLQMFEEFWQLWKCTHFARLIKIQVF